MDKKEADKPSIMDSLIDSTNQAQKVYETPLGADHQTKVPSFKLDHEGASPHRRIKLVSKPPVPEEAKSEEHQSNLTWEKLSIPPLGKKTGYTATPFKDYILLFGAKATPNGTSNMFGKNYDYSNEVILLDPKNNKFHDVKEDGFGPGARMGHTACLYKGNELVIFGGKDPKKQAVNVISGDNELAIMTLETIELLSVKWKPVNTLTTTNDKFGRLYHSANISENQMYVFGGLTPPVGLRGTNELLRLNLDTLEWTKCRGTGDVPEARIEHSSVLYQNKMFIFGGKVLIHYGDPNAGHMISNNLHMVDLTTLKWEQIQSEPPLKIRKFDSMEIFGSKIYILGSEANPNLNDAKSHALKNFYISDIKNKSWEVLPIQGDGPSADAKHRLVHYKNQLVLLGGQEQFDMYSVQITPEKNDYNQSNQTNKNQSKGSDETYIANFKKLFLEKTYSDITFVLQDQELPAHRNILAARCKHFADMFSSGITESKVQISDVQFPTFKAFLEFVYCNDLELDYSLATDLLELSDKYSFPELKDICEKFLGQQLTLDNYVNIAAASEQYNASLLRDAVVEFVIKNRHLLEKEKDTGDLSKALLWEIIFKIGKK